MVEEEGNMNGKKRVTRINLQDERLLGKVLRIVEENVSDQYFVVVELKIWVGTAVVSSPANSRPISSLTVELLLYLLIIGSFSGTLYLTAFYRKSLFNQN